MSVCLFAKKIQISINFLVSLNLHLLDTEAHECSVSQEEY